MLIGMVTKNGIFVEFTTNFVTVVLSLKRIIDASARRLRPIMMTAFTTLAGAIPLITSTGAGYESRVAVGTGYLLRYGLRDFVTLFVIPAMYRITGSTRSPGQEAVLNKELSQDNGKNQSRLIGFNSDFF
ncbi:efflux RND transporter permease subunit [Vibrio lentus]|nr:efflux RND transporter permease subunit [Vibrio lentus]